MGHYAPHQNSTALARPAKTPAADIDRSWALENTRRYQREDHRCASFRCELRRDGTRIPWRLCLVAMPVAFLRTAHSNVPSPDTNRRSTASCLAHRKLSRRGEAIRAALGDMEHVFDAILHAAGGHRGVRCIAAKLQVAMALCFRRLQADDRMSAGSCLRRAETPSLSRQIT